MKFTSVVNSSSGHYDILLRERMETIGQFQALYWESLITLGLFILAILVLI